MVRARGFLRCCDAPTRRPPQRAAPKSLRCTLETGTPINGGLKQGVCHLIATRFHRRASDAAKPQNAAALSGQGEWRFPYQLNHSDNLPVGVAKSPARAQRLAGQAHNVLAFAMIALRPWLVSGAVARPLAVRGTCSMRLRGWGSTQHGSDRPEDHGNGVLHND